MFPPNSENKNTGTPPPPLFPHPPLKEVPVFYAWVLVRLVLPLTVFYRHNSTPTFFLHIGEDHDLADN